MRAEGGNHGFIDTRFTAHRVAALLGVRVPNESGRATNGSEMVTMIERLTEVRHMAAYVCRGCGTEIANKGAFKKCPVCGITWD